MNKPTSLPVLNEQTPRVGRRCMLLVGVSAAALAACRADADIGVPGSGDPMDPGTGDDSGSTDNDSGSVDNDSGTFDNDAGTMPQDSGTMSPRDSGVTPHDSGTMTPRDSGTTPPPPVDSGTPPPPSCTPGPTSLGAVSNFASGTWTMNRSLRLVVAHDSGGLYAYSAVCTHEGCLCDPPDSSGQLFCGCHGSLFDGNGAVVNGPATRALAHYAVTVCSGTAYVDTSTHVSASTRTPV